MTILRILNVVVVFFEGFHKKFKIVKGDFLDPEKIEMPYLCHFVSSTTGLIIPS